MQSTRQKINQLRELLPKVEHRDRRVLAICIFVALVFWLILNLSRTYSINKEVSITYQLPEDRLLTNAPAQMADLAISGQGWNLLWESLTTPVIEIVLNVEDESDGYISKGDIARLIEQQLASSQLTVEQLNFLPVQLETEAKANKKVPLKCEVDFGFTEGFRPVGSPLLVPDSVTVYGLPADLEEIYFWTTDTLRATEISGDISLVAKLRTSSLPRVSLSESTVAFTQNVETFTEKSLYVPVTVRNAPVSDSFKIFPNQVRLKVAVLQSDFRNIVADSFLLVADLEGMRAENQRNSIPLVLERKPTSAISVQYTPRAAEYFLIKN